MKIKDTGSNVTGLKSETKDERLAAALRENLKRRKAQSRQRRGQDEGPKETGASRDTDSRAFLPKNDKN